MIKKKKQSKENSERWLLTYSDLITLLMILFILLYAMSNVSQEKYEQLSESLGESLGGHSVIDPIPIGEGSADVIDSELEEEQGTSETPTTVTETPAITKAPQEDTDPLTEAEGDQSSIHTKQGMVKLQTYMNDILKDLDLGSAVETSIQVTGLTISFSDDIFFDSGNVILKEEMKDSLKKIAVLLKDIGNTILVEGHTDNVPISNSTYSSNWQLSAVRAANVVEYLVEEEQIEGERISAIGYGEYRPKVSNNTKAGRDKNRRIDIIILYN